MKIFLLTGHRKSGTTLLHKLFDGSKGINIYPVDISLLYAYYPCYIKEKSFIEKTDRIRLVLTKSTREIEGMNIPNANKSFRAKEFIGLLFNNYKIQDLIEYDSIINALAETWCLYSGSDNNLPIVFKETSQSIYANKIRHTGLNIKVIQLIRDPRDNYAALKSGVDKHYSTIGEDQQKTLFSMINRARVDLMVAKELFVKEKWFKVVKFEDLVTKTEMTMRELSHFLKIDFSEPMLRPTLLGKEYFGNSYDSSNISGVSSKNVGNWSSRISKNEAAVIEFYMSDVMRFWGYKKCFNEFDSLDYFSEFYKWYNCEYFYYDAFLDKYQHEN
jgi:hypothetical protein